MSGSKRLHRAIQLSVARMPLLICSIIVQESHDIERSM